MSKQTMSACMKLVSKMDEQDQEMLLDRLGQYQKDGIPAERAQLMAASDTLAELETERKEFMALLREQHPDIFLVKPEQIKRDIKASTARDVTDTPQFKRWFGNSKVVDEDGNPRKMYHGTRRDFSVFDRLKSTEWRRASMDTVGSWFSSEPSKAEQYAGGEGLNVMPVYLSIQNPKMYRTFKDFLSEMHEAEGRKLSEQNPPGIGSTEGLRKKLKAEGYDGIVFEQTDNASLMQDIRDTQDAVNRARKEELSVKRAERQPYTQKRERLEKTLQSMGNELSDMGGSTEFDGQDVFIAFEPTQIKSAIGNNGQFDPANPDIRKSTAREPQFSEDIPNEDWLQGKIDYAQESPRNRFGVPKMSSVTGRFRDPVYVPTAWASELKGERGEQENVRQDSLAGIRKVIRETGKFPLSSGEEYVPYIEIGYDGQPWVSEGNHRIMAAAAEGLENIPVEVRYFDGGQRRAGKWAPENLVEITKRIAAERGGDIKKSAARQTETPQFKKWFGDSQVTDADGNPLVMYTGTSKDVDFTKFKIPKNGAWFTADPKAASMYAQENDSKDLKYNPDTRKYEEVNTASRVMPAYLRIENPATLSDADSKEMRYASNYRKVQGQIFDRLRAQGYDGVDMGDGVWVVIGKPEQIKSSLGNNGNFDPKNPDIRKSAARSPLGFYSALAKGIDDMPTKAALAGAWKSQIKGLVNKGVVKQDEVEWSGINDWLDLQQGKVAKEQIAEYLKQGGVQVEETALVDADYGDLFVDRYGRNEWAVFGDDSEDPIGGTFATKAEAWEAMEDMLLQNNPTKYGKWVLPGGKNYREVLLTLPTQLGVIERYQVLNDEGELVTTLKDRAAAERMIEGKDGFSVRPVSVEDRRDAVVYNSSHWDQSNVLAHIRLNDRTDAEGNRVLFVEEIQSDWGQEGKRHGFAVSQSELKRAREAFEKARAEDDAAWTSGTAADRERTGAARTEAHRVLVDLKKKSDAGSVIPVAPFVTKTEGWLNLALKRVMIMAAEGGYDKVAFVNGEQSADRYDLSKQVDSISYEPTANGYSINVMAGGQNVKQGDFTRSELEDIVGKEIVQKMDDREGKQPFDPEIEPDLADMRELSGLDLKVGGEGMNTFYDSIVPNAVKKLLPKVGGDKIVQVQFEAGSSDSKSAKKPMDTGEEIDKVRELVRAGNRIYVEGQEVDQELITNEQELDDFIGRDEPFAYWFASTASGLAQPGFEVTDAMREKVEQGLPLFSRQRGINVRNDGDNRYADLIVDGDKTMESRDSDSLRPYVGKTVGIIRTGEGAAKLIGSVNIGEPVEVDEAEFRRMEPQHLVPAGSRFDIKPGATKFLYPLTEAERFDEEQDVDSRGIVSRSVKFSRARQTDTPQFKRWSEDLPVIEGGSNYEGGPAVFVAYHGTTHDDITEFKRVGMTDGFLGKGPYFTTDADDASANYAGIGPDLTSRISREKDMMADAFEGDDSVAWDMLQDYFDANNIDQEITDENLDELKDRYEGDAIDHAATVALKGKSDGLMMKTYVKLTNPADTTGNQMLAYERIENDDGDITDEKGPAVDWVLMAREIGDAYGIEREMERHIDDVLEAAQDGQVSMKEIFDSAIKRLGSAYDGNGEIVSSGAIFSVIAEELGYDGVIMDAGLHFGSGRRGPMGITVKGMAGVKSDTLHIVPFSANQVKSATGNNGDFSLENNDIRKSAARQTETPQFKRWFGDSKVVDADGKPLVLYHGAKQDIEDGVFRMEKGMLGTGAYFTSNPQEADFYTANAVWRTDPNIVPAYVTIKNPYYAKDKWDKGALRAKENGHDGVILMAPGGGIDWAIPFAANQIKSAIGNNGQFDPANPDIRKSTGRTSTGANWDSPSASKFDDMVYKLQDKQVDLKRVVASIKDAAGSIADDLNVYLQEELYHGRTAKRTEDFVNMELKPLIDEMAKEGLTIADVEEYLHARHAPEANKVIAQRNPGVQNLQDGGSGMMTQDALNYMTTLPADLKLKLDSVAAKVDAIIKQTNQLYINYELESKDKIDGWGKMFQHYIPLQREDKDGSPGLGQGFSIKGKEVKGRTGSTRKVVDILANIALRREKVIVRGEKNRVSQSLVGLAQSNPNQDFWQVDIVPTERVFNPDTGLVEDRVDPLYKSRDNAVIAKIADANGVVREHAVLFNEEDPRALRMAQAMKNLDATALEGLMGVSAKISRYFASINTQLNPVFGIVNLVRDVQGALLNLSSTPLKGDEKKIAKYTASALKGVYFDARAARKGSSPSSAWSQLWDEFQSVGGQTGYRDLFSNSAERAEAIQKALNPDSWMDSRLGKIFTAGGALKVPLSEAKKGAGWIFDWISDYNLAMENGVRLAAYKAGLERGLSKEQAASAAKNLTVNFNRKGQTSQHAGALYAFFNASVQGTARIFQTVFEMDPGKPKTIRLSPMGKKIVYGGMMLGSMQAMAMAAAGFNDDDPPEFVRERSLIIPLPNKKYVTIPMPLGYHVLPSLGRISTEFVLSGFKDPHKRALSVANLFVDTFNPIGNAGLSMQTLAPTPLDPLVALTENKDWTGRPIARESSNKAIPGHALGRDTATTVAKLMSEGINTLSGGNKYTSGVFSPTPDQIDYLIGQVTGGVGRELSKVEQTVLSTARGEDLPTYKIPLVGRFVGDAKSQASEGTAFYANTERLNRLETEIKGLQKDGKMAEADELRRSSSESYLITMANQAERQIQKLRNEKRELIKAGAPREKVKEIEDRVTSVMARLNRATESLKEKAQ